MDKSNADYKQENIRNLRELKTGTPGFAAAGLGMTESFNNIQSETETFSYRLGTEIPLSFQNNMVNALNTAMDKADDLGDALKKCCCRIFNRNKKRIHATSCWPNNDWWQKDVR
jgi:hypothetical protein